MSCISASFLKITLRRQVFLIAAWLSVYSGIPVHTSRAEAAETAAKDAASLSTRTITTFGEYWEAAGREISRPIRMVLPIDFYDGGGITFGLITTANLPKPVRVQELSAVLERFTVKSSITIV